MGFLTFAGWVFDGRRRNVGEYGCFWSASEKSAKNAYYLNFNSSNVNPENNEDRAYAQSVRGVVESGPFAAAVRFFGPKSQPKESKTAARNFLLLTCCIYPR